MGKYGFIIFIVLSFIYNVFITDKGVMSFGDENIYYESILAIESISNGNLKEFSAHINSSRGRPGEAFIRLIPASIQGLLYKFFGISPANPDSLKIPILFNIIINIVVLLFFFKLAHLLFKDYKYALLAVLLYKFLINSNIYLRHIFPYEKSLAGFLLILIIYIKNRDNGFITYLLIGLLCGISFTIYPGYYFIQVLLALLVFTYDIVNKKDYFLFIKHGILISAGFLIIIIFFELFAWIGGRSYLNDSSALSETINQGSFDESLVFPFKYLLQVEGLSGITIIASCFSMIVYISKQLLQQTSKNILKQPLILIFIFSLSGMFIHGILGTVFHKMVFYGRLMHLYFPVLVLTIVFLISKIDNTSHRRILTLIITLVFMIHFIQFNIIYAKLGYPKDMLYKMKIDNKKFKEEQFICESTPLFNVLSPNPLNKETNAPYKNDSAYILLNCCIYFPVNDPNDFKPYIRDSLLICIEDKQHFETFPAYMMEGFSLEERKNLSARKYRIQFLKESIK